MSRHIKSAHEDTKNFKCDLCAFSVASKYLLKKHKDTDHPQEKANYFRCEVCNLGTSQQSKFLKHISAIWYATKINCTICKYVTHKKDYLNRHMKKAHKAVQDWQTYDKNVKARLRKYISTVYVDQKDSKPSK